VEEARKVVDASEMAAMPHCQLDPVGADAGTVYFCQPKDIGIVLRNTGEVGAAQALALASEDTQTSPAKVFAQQGRSGPLSSTLQCPLTYSSRGRWATRRP